MMKWIQIMIKKNVADILSLFLKAKRLEDFLTALELFLTLTPLQKLVSILEKTTSQSKSKNESFINLRLKKRKESSFLIL